MNRSIFLIGPTGAGKTTIGRILSQNLGLGFFDIDQELVKRTGVSIPTIFDYEGEVGFRIREANLVDELTKLNQVVIATGAGAILAAENRQRLSERGTVIYLQVSLEEQLQRTRNDKNRPLLQGDIKLNLSNMAKQRNHLYQQIATHTFKTDNSSARRLAMRIMATLEDAT